MKKTANIAGALAMVFCGCSAWATSPTLTLDIQTPSTQSKITYIDKHVFFVLDYSSSMDVVDRRLMHDVIYDSFYRDPNFSLQLGRGATLAMTFIAFSGKAKATETFAVNTAEDAMIALEKSQLSSSSYNAWHANVGSGTKIAPAFIAIGEVLDQEERYHHIQANTVSVVIMTDARPHDPVTASAEYNELISKYNINFSTITLNESSNGIYNIDQIPSKADALNQYCKNFVTEKGDLGPIDAYGRRAELQSGLCATVTASKYQKDKSFVDNPGSTVVRHALTLAGF